MKINIFEFFDFQEPTLKSILIQSFQFPFLLQEVDFMEMESLEKVSMLDHLEVDLTQMIM